MSESQQNEIPNKKIVYKCIAYSINKEEKTAGVIGSKSFSRKIIIPRSFPYNTEEFEVTSILKDAFKNSRITSVQFASDSKLRTIEEDAFSKSSIDTIYIPSQLVELKNGWCRSASKIMNIIISPDNPYFKMYEDKMLLGRTNLDSPNFDRLIFCLRTIETITIPNFIKHICSCSFQECDRLQRIEIPNDSQLETIEDYAFSDTPIESFTIPSTVKYIGKYAFSNCLKLCKIEILNDSKLEIIDDFAFTRTLIESITIPSTVIRIGRSAFDNCRKLYNLRIGKDSKLQKIDAYAFSHTIIMRVIIPSQVIEFGEGTFFHCKSLCHFDFMPDSQLKTFNKSLLFGSLIDSIIIPSQVTRIERFAFSDCKYLNKLEFAPDSNLHTIEKEAFSGSAIDTISIPSKLVELEEGWCRLAPNIVNINVSQDNPYFKMHGNKMILKRTNLDSNIYDQLIFCARNVKRIKIPNFIKHICSYAFYECKELRRIEMSDDSQLQTIENYAFYETSIENFIIPSQVTKIGNYAFSGCERLRRFKIGDDSKIQAIEENAFLHVPIESIVIPSTATEINKFVFYYCDNIQIIEFNAKWDCAYYGKGIIMMSANANN